MIHTYMTNYWIKLYHEILRDPKMGQLDDHTWRRTIELFLIAGEFNDSERLPPIPDTVWLLRTSELADKFYFTNELNREEWNVLIEWFERAQRSYRAANLRKRFGIYSAMSESSEDKVNRREPAGKESG